MLLEVKKPKGRPMTGTLQLGPDVDPKVQIDDPTEQGGDCIQNDDRVGEPGRWHGTKAAEKRTGEHARNRPRRQSLMRNCAKQCDGNQAVNDQEYCRQNRSPAVSGGMFT